MGLRRRENDTPAGEALAPGKAPNRAAQLRAII